MTRSGYATHTLGVCPRDCLGPALLQARCRQWQQEVSPEVLDEIRLHLLDRVSPGVLHPLAEPTNRERTIRRAIRDWLEHNQVALLSQGGEPLVAYLYSEVAGFGPLQPFLTDPEITEIKLIDPQTLLVERAGRCLCRTVAFPGGVEEVRRLATRLAELGGRAVSRREPVAQVQLADGSRILLMPFEDIPQILVRRRAAHAFDLEGLLAYGTLDEPTANYLRRLAQAQAFFLVAGPSGSGKTAFLEAILTLFPQQAHIVVVQQGTEIRRVHPLITLLEGVDDPAAPNSLEAVAMRTLKMGTITLVVGETKGPEAAAILHGISAGVKGGGTTIHTDDPEEALRRLARLCCSSRFTDLFAGAMPQELRQAVARSVHVVVQLEQTPNSGRRYVRQVAEVEIAEDGWRLHPVVVGTVRPAADEQVSWEHAAESIPRIQALLSSYVEAAAEPSAARLAAERRSEAEQLLATTALLLNSGDWDEAEKVVQQVLDMFPEEEDAHKLAERISFGRKETLRVRTAEAGRIQDAAGSALHAGDLAELERLAAAAGLAHLDELAAELATRLEEAREDTLPVDELFAQALERTLQDPEYSTRLLRAVLRRQPDHAEAGFYLELLGGEDM